MVQPLFSGKVFAQYKLILLPFSVRNLIAPQPQTIVPNPIPPGTSPPPDELGEALFLFSFIPLHCHLKRQLPHLLTVHPFRDQAIYNEKYEVLQYFSHPSTHWNTIPPGTSPLSEGLGEAALPPFLFLFGLGEATPPFFKYFRPLPHLLSNIENMSTLFSVKIPLFCPSLQQLMLQSTNSLLFISSLLYPLIPSCSPPSDVYSLSISPDYYTFL